MSSRDLPPQDILVPISVGALMYKNTILEIKSERLKNPSQLDNVSQELAALRAVRLGDVEDGIRECDARGDFGQSFIDLARAVYRLNDERSRLKKAINLASGSRLV